MDNLTAAPCACQATWAADLVGLAGVGNLLHDAVSGACRRAARAMLKARAGRQAAAPRCARGGEPGPGVAPVSGQAGSVEARKGQRRQVSHGMERRVAGDPGEAIARIWGAGSRPPRSAYRLPAGSASRPGHEPLAQPGHLLRTQAVTAEHRVAEPVKPAARVSEILILEAGFQLAGQGH
jgi:hypothetical protein